MKIEKEAIAFNEKEKEEKREEEKDVTNGANELSEKAVGGQGVPD